MSHFCFADLSPGVNSGTVRFIKLTPGAVVVAFAPSGDAARMCFTSLSAVTYIILDGMKR